MLTCEIERRHSPGWAGHSPTRPAPDPDRSAGRRELPRPIAEQLGLTAPTSPTTCLPARCGLVIATYQGRQVHYALAGRPSRPRTERLVQVVLASNRPMTAWTTSPLRRRLERGRRRAHHERARTPGPAVSRAQPAGLHDGCCARRPRTPPRWIDRRTRCPSRFGCWSLPRSPTTSSRRSSRSPPAPPLLDRADRVRLDSVIEVASAARSLEFSGADPRPERTALKVIALSSSHWPPTSPSSRSGH